MDYMTHTLFGTAVYGAVNKTNMDRALKWSLFAASVGANVIPDIDVQWANTGDRYLMWHRGITHSFLMVPVWAAMFSLLCYIAFRAKDLRIFLVGIVGVLLHILSDWTNAWGTGLFEPFTSQRYAIGIIPNKGSVFWVIAAFVIVLLLLFRKKSYRLRICRSFWVLSALYVCFQIAQGAYVYFDLKADGYDRVAIRADQWPGGLSYYAKKGDDVTEGRYELGIDGVMVTSSPIPNDPVAEDLLETSRKARELLLFAPFVVTQDKGDYIRVFDPRFGGKVGFLEAVVPKK